MKNLITPLRAALVGAASLTALSLAFSAPAQAISSVTWASGTSGTFGAGGSASGTTVTLTNVTNPALTSSLNLNPPNYSPPLGSQIIARYRADSNWTATFSSAVSGLGLYANQWFAGTYTFDQPVAILSGLSGATLLNNTLTLPGPAATSYNGILQFLAPVSSFSVTASGTNTSNNRITFAAPVPLETDALPVVGTAVFMAGGIWWKKKRAGVRVADFVANK